MTAIMEKDLNGLQTMMEKEVICWGDISRLARDADGQSYMVTELPLMNQYRVSGGERCIIFSCDADSDNVNPYLMNLMGRRVPFVVTSIDEENDRLICSRKRAQQLLY